MKKVLQRLLSLSVCAIMFVLNLAAPVSAAAEEIYELTFDNLFIFEQWANHPNMKVLSDDAAGGTLTCDVSKGSFVLVNNTTATEVFTAFSMSSVGAMYSMPVEENTEYMLSYVANGTTTNFEAMVFYFDKSGQYTSLEAENAHQYGLNEWCFTTPAGTGYIQVRFDNNSPSSDVTVSDIKIRSKAVYEYAVDFTHRKTFTYTAGATYGALPVPQREGLVFAGWFTNPDGTGEKITSATTATAASRSLFSKWDPIVVGELAMVSLPLKRSYCVGEKLDTRGLVIGVTYPDGEKENIDEGFAVSPEYLTATGTQTVTVTYGNSSTQFDVSVKASEDKTITVNGTQKTVACANYNYTLDYSGSSFNRYVIKYSSDAYVKGELNFNGVTEEFFLEPDENGEFSGYIDGFMSGTTRNAITGVAFKALDKNNMDFTFKSIDLSSETNPGDSEGMVYLSDSNYKIGIDLDWGGALTYMEDLTNSVMSSVKKYGTKTTEVDFKSKVGTTSFAYNTSSNVNLINAHDTGRLVQQSYYGTGSYPYEPGMYGEAVWNYNPVQGGNLYNEASKIVDVKVSDNEIYIKCRPLDWAKEAIHITPSYMEARYTLENGMMRATCRFVDYSGYPAVTTTQELPAFYCVEPLNDFVYYAGGEPWSDSNTKINRTDLKFWGTATDQDFICNENWAAFKGDDDDSFAIGIYCPGQTLFHTGVYYSGDGATRCSTTSPATEDPTSYMGIVDVLRFRSYTPISYCYYISTGKVDDIRGDFKTIAQKDTDICNATQTNGFCDMCQKQIMPEINEDNAYEISNAGELHWFRDFVNSGNVNANAVLTCDITDNDGVLTGYGTPADDTSAFRKWTPIGNATYKYNGHFDGQGHTINGLYMNDSSLSYGGLFGYTGSDAVIEKVGIDYSSFSGNQYVGSLCGRNEGRIDNCYSFYTMLQGDSYVGGVTGFNNKTVTNSYNAGLVNGSSFVGGVAGANTGTVSGCYYLINAATDGTGTSQNGVGSSANGSVTADVSGATEGKTVADFASGEIAYLLQKVNTTQLWGQKTNASGSGPVFDKSGYYKVKAVTAENAYTLTDIGDIVDDGEINVQDYQTLVNQVVSDEKLDFNGMINSDIDGDGYIDVIDASLMQLMITGFYEKVDVYLKGDFDFDGIPFTQEDISAIKKGLINQDRLNTRQKYACDLNGDGVLDINDKDALLSGYTI